MWREYREPLPLLGDVLDRPVNPRQPDRELVAKAIHRVVGASGLDSFNREIGPLRMLRREQTTHQLAIGFDLVVVHPRLRHGQQLRRRDRDGRWISPVQNSWPDDLSRTAQDRRIGRRIAHGLCVGECGVRVLLTAMTCEKHALDANLAIHLGP